MPATALTRIPRAKAMEGKPAARTRMARVKLMEGNLAARAKAKTAKEVNSAAAKEAKAEKEAREASIHWTSQKEHGKIAAGKILPGTTRAGRQTGKQRQSGKHPLVAAVRCQR